MPFLLTTPYFVISLNRFCIWENKQELVTSQIRFSDIQKKKKKKKIHSIRKSLNDYALVSFPVWQENFDSSVVFSLYSLHLLGYVRIC